MLKGHAVISATYAVVSSEHAVVLATHAVISTTHAVVSSEHAVVLATHAVISTTHSVVSTEYAVMLATYIYFDIQRRSLQSMVLFYSFLEVFFLRITIPK